MTGLFQELEKRYTSLGMREPLTNNSIELRGDVLENILAFCRYTGPKVDNDTKESRVQFNNLMVQFSRVLDSILSSIFSCNNGAPRKHHWPDADLLVIVLYRAHTWHAEHDPVKQGKIHQEFEQIMTQALQSVNVGRSHG